MKSKKKALRKCLVLREVKIDPRELKKGDIFRLLKASPSDKQCNEEEYAIAVDDAETLTHDKDYAAIKSEPIAFVPRTDHHVYRRFEVLRGAQ